MPERDLEASKRKANTWEAKYYQAEEARISAERRAGDTDLAAIASSETAAKEK